MAGVLVDTNIIIDMATRDPVWSQWSVDALARLGGTPLYINPIIYAEVAAQYDSREEVERMLASWCEKLPLPYDAAFWAGKAFLAYRRRGGARTSPLPDFFIGAHAMVAGYKLLTRDAARYRTYFPTIELIAP